MANESEIIVLGRKKKYNVFLSDAEIVRHIDRLPTKNECFKFISDGGFSAISFIKFIADRDSVLKLHASTLRVGIKELAVMDWLHRQGKLIGAHFLVGKIMADDKKMNKRYGYYKDFAGVCAKNGWTSAVSQNHSKVLLFACATGAKYIIETSSNLNKNPSVEQFSLEQDAELHSFYVKNLFERTK